MNAPQKQSVFNAKAHSALSRAKLTRRPLSDTFTMPQFIRLFVWLLAILACTAGSVGAQNLPAAGDGKDMWVVLPEADKGLTILHRKAQDTPGHFWKVTTLPGLLSPGGSAAGQSQLWLIYNNMMVQAIALATDPAMPQARYSQASFFSSLPEDVTLRSLAGSNTALWALVDVKTAAALEALDNPNTSLSDDDNDNGDDEIIYPSGEAATNATTNPAADAAASKSAESEKSADDKANDKANAKADAKQDKTASDVRAFEKPAARLVNLKRGPWQTLDLPADWSVENRAWIAVTQMGEEYPTLIAEHQQLGKHSLRVYHYNGQSWDLTSYTTPAAASEVAFLSIQQQLVMAARSPDQDKMIVTLWVLRPERKEAVQVGQLSLDEPSTSNWGIAADGLSATLVMQNGAKPPVAASINLMGQTTHPAAPIVIEQHPKFVQNPGQMLLVGVVAISIFLMFVIWRRDPNLDDVTLPKDMVLADFGRRLGAVAIDLGPCIFVAMLATGVDLSKLQHDWPGRTGNWFSMIPGFITIGLFVLHTGLSELFTGKTLGKAICGIHVISTTGGPPNIWQILARNLLKAFDLIAFYILPVLALVGKHRQRLGDLVGKTLVVMPTQPPPPDQLVEDLPGKKNKSDEQEKPDTDKTADNDASNDSAKDSAKDASDNLPPRV